MVAKGIIPIEAARERRKQQVARIVHDYEFTVEARDKRIAELEARLARVGKGCMLAILAIEAVPYWNGMKQVNAYEAFISYWIGTLQSDDMSYLRGLMGIPEPNTPEGKAWMEANQP